MNITVFGASGKVGQQVVRLAREHGHSVTAFVHSQNPFDGMTVQVVKGDISQADDIARALQGSDAVISTLSSWGTSGKDILATAMRQIIPAMQTAGLHRIVSLTGADARAPGDSIGLVHRLSYPLLKVAAGKILTDGETHIRLLTTSGLDWTVVRSPVMNDYGDPAKARLVSARPLPWQTIHRQSVAQCMLAALEQGTHEHQAPFIIRH